MWSNSNNIQAKTLNTNIRNKSLEQYESVSNFKMDPFEQQQQRRSRSHSLSASWISSQGDSGNLQMGSDWGSSFL